MMRFAKWLIFPCGLVSYSYIRYYCIVVVQRYQRVDIIA